MSDRYTTINMAGEFRIFLHRLLLGNSTYIDVLKGYINTEFETLSTEYTESQTFQFKIKKTNLKKKNFTHSVDFYYSYTDNAIYSFLTDYTIQRIINDALKVEPNAENIKYVYDEMRCRNMSCRYIYNLATVQDNIVVLTI